MFLGLLILSAISALATWGAAQLHIPIPGAILGLLVLLFICFLRGKPGAAIERSSQTLILFIPLLILPSCIGIMDHWHLIKEEWLAIMVAILTSVVFTLVTTPWLYSKLKLGEDNGGAS